MNPTILASLISAAAAIIVCMVNNHFTLKRTEKAQQDNIVLISYRLEQLEHKVDKHNNFAERIPVIEEHIKGLDQRVSDLEKKLD